MYKIIDGAFFGILRPFPYVVKAKSFTRGVGWLQRGLFVF
jgi:hypothetical protein